MASSAMRTSSSNDVGIAAEKQMQKQQPASNHPGLSTREVAYPEIEAQLQRDQNKKDQRQQQIRQRNALPTLEPTLAD